MADHALPKFTLPGDATQPMQQRHNPDLDCPLDEQLDAFVLLDTEVQSPADLDQHVSDTGAVLFVVAQSRVPRRAGQASACAEVF